MVRSIVGTLILAAATLSKAATAQGFEGTVTIRLTAVAPNGAPGVGGMIMEIKGAKSATETRLVGQEVHIVTDLSAGTRSIWLPKPANVQLPPELVAAGAVNGLMFSRAIKVPPAVMATPKYGPKIELKALGTSETIAGLHCDDYEMIAGPQGVFAKSCATTALGRFSFPDMSDAPGNSNAPPSWAKAFDDQTLFPLKVSTTDGKSTLEVVSVRRHPVPDSVFVVPPGYLDMAKYKARAGAGRGV